jgi:hypothetical protein
MSGYGAQQEGSQAQKKLMRAELLLYTRLACRLASCTIVSVLMLKLLQLAVVVTVGLQLCFA